SRWSSSPPRSRPASCWRASPSPTSGGSSRRRRSRGSRTERAHHLLAEPRLGERYSARVGRHAREIVLARRTRGDVVETLLEAREHVQERGARGLRPACGAERICQREAQVDLAAPLETEPFELPDACLGDGKRLLCTPLLEQ